VNLAPLPCARQELGTSENSVKITAPRPLAHRRMMAPISRSRLGTILPRLSGRTDLHPVHHKRVLMTLSPDAAFAGEKVSAPHHVGLQRFQV
jgi:hypothetical protein